MWPTIIGLGCSEFQRDPGSSGELRGAGKAQRQGKRRARDRAGRRETNPFKAAHYVYARNLEARVAGDGGRAQVHDIIYVTEVDFPQVPSDVCEGAANQAPLQGGGQRG